jgi:hypothetical protein
MSSFRPTPFTRAFRSLDAFTADVESVVVVPVSVEPEPQPQQQQPKQQLTTPNDTTTFPTAIIMDFEQETIRSLPPSPSSLYSSSCSSCSSCRRNQRDRDFEYEYELKVLQMKLNWLMFILFVFMCILIFKRS